MWHKLTTMNRIFLKTVVLTAGLVALYHYALIEKQTAVALVAFVLGYFFGEKVPAIKRSFRKDRRDKVASQASLNHI